MAKTKYYSVDAGFFPQIMYLCFSDDALQQLFEDNKLSTGIHAFDKGEAETITIQTHHGQLIIMVFDLGNYEMELDDTVWIGVISHEVSHAVEKLGHLIGEENIAGETRAYFTQSVVEQIYSASLIERKEHARKANRSLLNKKHKTTERPMSEVDLDDNGSAGSDSDIPKPAKVRRTKNAKGRDQSETEDSVQPVRTARVSSDSDSV